jgi:molybdopterin converting factor small subunit
LYDESGEFYPIIQVLLNGEEWVTPDQLDRLLRDGDNILLMVMMAGG